MARFSPAAMTCVISPEMRPLHEAGSEKEPGSRIQKAVIAAIVAIMMTSPLDAAEVQARNSGSASALTISPAIFVPSLMTSRHCLSSSVVLAWAGVTGENDVIDSGLRD